MLNNFFSKKKILYFFIIFFIFFLDRISKYLILNFVDKSINQELVINSFLSINLVYNKGIAFGLFQSENIFYYNFISLLILGVILILFWLVLKSKGLEKISYLFIIGGGAGNFFDRIYYRSVIDFIDINFNNFNWFIFNIADIFITIGIIILIIMEFIRKKK